MGLATPSTWAWSDCPALAAADFLASTVYGAAEPVDWSTVPAAANDYGIISRFWCSIGPLFGPILMSAKRFGEKTESTVVGHDIFSSAAVARLT